MEGQHNKSHGAKKEVVEEKRRLELRKKELNDQLLSGDDVHNQLNQIQAAAYDVDQKILQIPEERPSSFKYCVGQY